MCVGLCLFQMRLCHHNPDNKDYCPGHNRSPSPYQCNPDDTDDETDVIKSTPAKGSEHSESLLLTGSEDRRSSVCTNAKVLVDHGKEHHGGGGSFPVMANPLIDTDADLPRVSFCSVGLYKGSVVAIKNISKRHIDLSRSIRKELKQVWITFILFII